MITIIIPTFNHLEQCLKPCIESLVKYTDLTDKEIIIVANGCRDGTKEYLELLNPAYFKTVWNDTPLGYPRAINAGLKEAAGEYIVLLNDDTVILGQVKDTWINMLKGPFESAEVGITGPLVGYSGPADAMFAIFFCVMIRKQVFDRIGYLDETFSPGGGEDTAFCIEAGLAGYKTIQVPSEGQLHAETGMMIGGFPIYHKGEATVGELEGWEDIFKRNSDILTNRYNKRWRLSNNCERAVIGQGDEIPPRELTRYKFALDEIILFRNRYGRKPDIIEYGCSSGYGIRLFGNEVNSYTGVDYADYIIDYAKGEFINENNTSKLDFQVLDIEEIYQNSSFKDCDIIIAYEVLEHLEHGLEIAQELKKHCSVLLATTPYNEEPGFWGPHHKLHRLKEENFPDFDYRYINGNGEMSNIVWGNTEINLILMRWYKDYPNVKEEDELIGTQTQTSTVELEEDNNTDVNVIAFICTKGRYYTTLPLTLIGLSMQTRLPNSVLIYDDGEGIDLNEIPIYKHIFLLLTEKGVKVNILWGAKLGQHYGHQYINSMAKELGYEWIWRLDDDELPEPTVLDTYLNIIKEHDTIHKPIGAVGNSCREPLSGKDLKEFNKETDIKKYNIRIEDIDLPCVQWEKGNILIETEHLHSSFIYRPGIVDYDLSLSNVAHREETIFTHLLYRAGYRLLVALYSNTYHFKNPEGGIRTNNNIKDYEHDDYIFYNKYINTWNVKTDKYIYIVLDNGLGDHLAFKLILKDIEELYKGDKEIILAVVFPEVFEDTQHRIISIAHAKAILRDIGVYNIYGWMERHKWGGTLKDAFYEYYKKGIK